MSGVDQRPLPLDAAAALEHVGRGVAQAGLAGVTERHMRDYLEMFGDPDTAVEALRSVHDGKPFRPAA